MQIWEVAPDVQSMQSTRPEGVALAYGRGSVFDAIHALSPGDAIYVDDADGGRSEFIVRSLRRFDPDADTSDIFGSDDGEAHLNLITCEGVWDEEAQQYTGRLVVFADRR